MPSDTSALEERLAYLERAIDDLSDTVARQDQQIDILNRRIGLLVSREAQREADGGGSVLLGDEKPPHY